LMAEMLTRGSTRRDKQKLAEQVEALGTSLDAFSGRNSFGVSVSGLSDDFARLLDLASDALLHPAFPEAELARLKQEVIQQIAAEDESMMTQNLKLLRPLLFGAHPYARQPLGRKETVEKATVADLKKLHTAWVQPENLSIGVVGAVEPVAAVREIEKQFAELKTGSFREPNVPAIAELPKEAKADEARAGLTGAMLSLGFRGTSLKSPDREVLDLLAALLSGLGGRLNVSLREKQGLAYAVGVFNDAQLDGGGVIFYIQTDEPSLEKSLNGMWVEARKLRDELVPAKELETVKRYLTGTEAIELQNQSHLAQRLALAELYGEGAANVFTRRKRIEQITPEALQAAAIKYLDPQHWASAIVRPKK